MSEATKIEEAIIDLKKHLSISKRKRREIIVIIEEQERQLNTLEIIKNK